MPYKIHTVLTDNGVHFTTPGNRYSMAAEIRLALEKGELFRAHAFEFACAKADIDHRLTKPKHPWTNGQVERMNRTLKEATVKRFYYETHGHFRQHLADFVNAYNFARRPQNPQRTHTLRVHLLDLDKRAATIHTQSNPSKPGTKHLGVHRGLGRRPSRGIKTHRRLRTSPYVSGIMTFLMGGYRPTIRNLHYQT